MMFRLKWDDLREISLGAPLFSPPSGGKICRKPWNIWALAVKSSWNTNPNGGFHRIFMDFPQTIQLGLGTINGHAPIQEDSSTEAFDPFGLKGALKDTVEGLMDRSTAKYLLKSETGQKKTYHLCKLHTSFLSAEF